MLTVAAWNVNSIRARLDRLLNWLDRTRPDIACLQELKVVDDDFPRAELEAAGYQAAVHGQKTYNGVAILSRTSPEDIHRGMGDGVDDAEARLVEATVHGIRVISAYVPNGRTVGSEKWGYKLDWLARLRRRLERAADPSERILLCGDFNVAPERRDVAKPEEWEGTVLCHDDAREAFRSLVGWGLVDTVRLHNEGEGPYTWWDYRMLGFPRNNGLRIDHILATRSMADRCAGAWVDREERKGKQPSDHAPVLAAFEM